LRLHATARHRTPPHLQGCACYDRFVPGDTSPEVEARRRARLRAMTVEERVGEGLRLCRSARNVMRDGIRHRHPEYDDEEVELAFARLLWGDALFRAARPGYPLLDP
jgi:hypothetical protein